ncbi:MAG TPA: glycine cleavage system protein GcvH [Anaerolineaceae bacterium]
MSNPSNLKYTQTDEWILVDGNVGTIGVTDYAQEQLSDVVYVEITVSEGELVKKGTTIASIESVKAAADVTLPVSGKVTQVNTFLPETPELVNSDPFGKAWMLKIEISDPAELETLMDAKAYDAFLLERSH